MKNYILNYVYTYTHTNIRTKFIIRVRIRLVIVILLLLIYMTYRVKHINIFKSTETFLHEPYTHSFNFAIYARSNKN